MPVMIGLPKGEPASGLSDDEAWQGCNTVSVGVGDRDFKSTHVGCNKGM